MQWLVKHAVRAIAVARRPANAARAANRTRDAVANPERASAVCVRVNAVARSAVPPSRASRFLIVDI